jgi:hypothetical protein
VLLQLAPQQQKRLPELQQNSKHFVRNLCGLSIIMKNLQLEVIMPSWALGTCPNQRQQLTCQRQNSHCCVFPHLAEVFYASQGCFPTLWMFLLHSKVTQQMHRAAVLGVARVMRSALSAHGVTTKCTNSPCSVLPWQVGTAGDVPVKVAPVISCLIIDIQDLLTFRQACV